MLSRSGNLNAPIFFSWPKGGVVVGRRTRRVEWNRKMGEETGALCMNVRDGARLWPYCVIMNDHISGVGARVT